MANEIFNDAIGGAAKGYSVGGLTGALGGGIGGIIGGIGKRNARKRAEKRLRQALAKLMAGSTDVYGNTLSADKNGRWSYALSDTGNAAKNIANRAINNANTYQNRTNRQLADDNALINALANIRANNAARSAVSRAGLRTGSNMSNSIGNLARQATNNLRDAWLNGLTAGKNANQYNLNMRSGLISNAINGMQPIGSMQSNLQNMVQGLNMPTANMSLGVASSINKMNDVSSNSEDTKNRKSVILGLSNLFSGK